MAKLIAVSEDDAVYYALPGSTGEFSEEMETPEDTIFGQSFQSNESGILSWTISANAVFKGFAGYFAKVLKSGTSTAMTGEATTSIDSLTYQITNPAKQVINRLEAVTVLDDGSPVDGEDIEYIDFLFGIVKFVSGYSVEGPITITGEYLPMENVGTANSFTLTQTADTIDTTDFATAQGNGGYRTYDPGLRTVSIELSGFFSTSNGFHDIINNRDEVIIEVNPDGNGDSVARGFFKPGTRSQSGDVGALEEESITFNLQVPVQQNLNYVFRWLHSATTTIPDGIRVILDAWLNETKPYVQYLHDGENGLKGQAVVTDVSLESSIDGMNTFTADFQGTGGPSTVSA